MIRTILGVLLIILVAGVIGVDCCTCGYGPQVRHNINSWCSNQRLTEKSTRVIEKTVIKVDPYHIKVGPDAAVD
jgi:hypothetical protein